MCFSSGAKEQKIPPPTPPTTFDYSAGQRGQTQAAIASSAATQQASFGSELGAASGASPLPGQ